MKEKLNFDFKKHFVYICAAFIFFLFLFITCKTPLSGDDWGFYLNAQYESPITLAFQFYQSFSGRFFSELWEHFGATNKWFWNILNPTLFTIIFLCINKLCFNTKKQILTPLLVIAIILSVDDAIRMQTYTWLTGEIYVIPLALSLLYFCLIDNIIFKTAPLKKKEKILLVVSSLICFYVGLTMENIAGIMIVANIFFCIYTYFNKRQMLPYLLFLTAVSTFAFLLMRSSPGSAARLVRDHYAWTQMSIFEQLQVNYPNFLYFTFINNNYLILFLSIVTIMVTTFSERISGAFKTLIILLNIIATVAVFSFVLPEQFSFLCDQNSLFSYIYWPIYTIFTLIFLFKHLQNNERDKAIFFLVMAGGANIAMMLSPIFGARSSLYTIYFIICVIVILLNSVDLPKVFTLLLMIIVVFVCVDRTNEYIYKYNLVEEAQKERLSIIEYYKENPDVEEAWIPRFPIYTLHSIDVEPGDTYHLETFKNYFGLPQDADKIIFYFKDTD